MFKKLKLLVSNSRYLVLMIFILTLVFLFIPEISLAEANWVVKVIGGIIYYITSALALFLLLVIKVFVMIASFQDFIGHQSVVLGWIIVRNIANMFFIVALLIIAFATILQLENYNFKKWLPKLVLMAVLINFSKTICGLLIDIAQIFMLTFVNAIKDVAGGNFGSLFGIKEIFTMANESKDGGWTILTAYILGLVYVIVAIVVMITFLAVLVMRMIMIWIYVILSPLAYLFSAFPGANKYASQWWSEFSKNLIVGPVLAFFVWLSLATIHSGAILSNMELEYDAETRAVERAGRSSEVTTSKKDESLAVTEAGKPSVFINFVVGIGMLVGGLKISQEIGGAAGSIAGKGMSKLNSMASSFGRGVRKRASRFAGRQAKRGAKFVGRKTLKGISNIAVNKSKGKTRLGSLIKGMGVVGQEWAADLEDTRKKEKVKKKEKFLRSIGMDSRAASAIQREFSEETEEGRERRKTAENVKLGATVGAIGTITGGALPAFSAAVAMLTTVMPGLGALTGGLLSFRNEKAREAHNEKVREADKEVSEAEIDVENKYKKYQDTLEDQGGDEAGLGVKTTRIDWEDAQKKLTEAKEKRSNLDFKRDSWGAQVKNKLFGIDETVGAAKNIDEDESEANRKTRTLAEDPEAFKDLGNSFYRSSLLGQNSGELAFIRKLSGEDEAAGKARENIEKGIKGAGETEIELANIRKIAFGLNAAKQFGIDMDNFSSIIRAIEGKYKGSALGGSSVADLKASPFKYRDASWEAGEGLEGDGSLRINTLASKESNLERGKEHDDIMAVSFPKLAEQFSQVAKEDPSKKHISESFAEDALGFHVKQEDVPMIFEVLKPVFEERRLDLSQMLANGEINELDYNKQVEEIDTVEERFEKNDFDKGLMLANSNSKSFGRESKLTTTYHEIAHSAGVKSDNLAEYMAEEMKDKKLYGRNPETKVRHAFEVGVIVKEMEDQNKSEEDIKRVISEEVVRRSTRTRDSSAQIAINKEKGVETTETEFIQSSDKSKSSLREDPPKIQASSGESASGGEEAEHEAGQVDTRALDQLGESIAELNKNMDKYSEDMTDALQKLSKALESQRGGGTVINLSQLAILLNKILASLSGLKTDDGKEADKGAKELNPITIKILAEELTSQIDAKNKGKKDKDTEAVKEDNK